MENQSEANMSANKKVSVGLSSNQLDAIERSLLDAPVPPRPLTRNKALLKLAPTLRELVKRGHTKGSISELLSAQGLTASTRAISRALTCTPRKKKQPD